MQSDSQHTGSSEKKKKHVGEYELGRTLGEGAFGKVKLGTNIFTGEQVAIKIISGEQTRTKKDILQLERERSILIKMKHPNIVNLIKVVDDDAHNRCYLILEYVSGGELFDYIIAHGRLSETDARRFMRQIISAVEYCHSLLVVHRDLKPENLLLDDKLNIKISDFGLSNVMTPGKKFSTFCGSLHYACPEILKGKEYLGPGVDIWAMGIILYCLVVGRQPWDGNDATELITCILEDGLEIPDGISDGCVNLILSMLRVNEADRISLSAMRHHAWVNEGYDEPPKCYLAEPGPVDVIDEFVYEQVRQMHLVKDDVEARDSIHRGLKENQCVAIYHLLATSKQEKLVKEAAEKKKAALTGVVQSRDRRSMSELSHSTGGRGKKDHPSSHASRGSQSPSARKIAPLSLTSSGQASSGSHTHNSNHSSTSATPTTNTNGTNSNDRTPPDLSPKHSPKHSPKSLKEQHQAGASASAGSGVDGGVDGAKPSPSSSPRHQKQPSSASSSSASHKSGAQVPKSEPITIRAPDDSSHAFGSGGSSGLTISTTNSTASSASSGGTASPPKSPSSDPENPFGEPQRRLSTPTKQKKKTIIVSKFDNLRTLAQSSSPGRRGSLTGDEDDHSGNSVPTYSSLAGTDSPLMSPMSEGQRTPTGLNSNSGTHSQPPSPSPPPRSKTPRKSSKPDRPILNLEHVVKDRADRLSPSPKKTTYDGVKNRVSRTGSGSYFGLPKPMAKDLFQDPGVTAPVKEKDSKETAKLPSHNELSDEKTVPVEFRTKLVSALPISELCAQIEGVLNKHSIYYTNKRGVMYKCKYTTLVGIPQEVQFTIEVIKKSSSERGVKVKRTGGSGFAYQTVHQILLNDLKL